jgi:uncharacterized membrane protein YphA (DoxX/SURF4 family)
MQKTKKITYWIATLWLALGMVSTGIVQLMQMEEEVQKFNELGYPTNLMTLLGIWKILGTIAILLPRFTILKEWAYAGFFFAMSGAALSHIQNNHSLAEIAPSLLLLTLTFVSWYMRPDNRKILPQNT